MAAIGGVMGELKYRLDSLNMANDNCWTVQPAQRQIGVRLGTRS